MKVQKLEIENFLTIGKGELELGDRGLLLIQGENNDDTSAGSNGAGKSSVVDALAWVLYGVTAREVSGDAVVNGKVGKDCCVSVVLTEPGKEYRIVRYRKHKTAKNMVTISERDTVTGVGTDISKGTDKETQEVINQVLGCSLDVFMTAVYAGQERMPDLPGMTDKQLKVLIEEAAGVEVLTEAYQIALKRAMTAGQVVATAKNAVALAAGRRDSIAANLTTYQEHEAVFEGSRRDRAKAELAKAVPLTKELAELKASPLLTEDKTELAEKRKQSAEALGKFSLESEELTRLEDMQVEHERQSAIARAGLAARKKQIEQAEAAAARIDEQVGKLCGECGKPYSEHDLEGAKKARATSIAAMKKELIADITKAKDIAAKAADARAAADAYRATMTDPVAITQLHMELTEKLSKIDVVERRMANAKEQIDQIKANANVKLSEPNGWAKMVESAQQELEEADKVVAEKIASLETAEAAHELAEEAAKVFGPAGVRAHILDTVTPFLNERTRDYLGAFSDGNIHATWSTLTKTAKGELREKFNIEVINDKGAKSFAGLSGGEKRKVRIATAMALQDMVASRATKPIDIFIADEVDDALANAGLERLMGVLERKARERGTVVVISHNSLGDWIDEVITVTKDGGSSTLSGATAPGF